MEAFVLFFVFALLLLLGTPIAVCLGISSILSMLVLGAGRPVSVVLGTVPQLVSAATSKSVLLAIPFFILGGNIMEKSGISGKLINLAESCVGHLKGGVAMVCVIVACFFAAISGSGPATVAALGMSMVHFGTIMIVNLAIGLVTPPVGVNLYVACGIADVDLRKISVSVVPLLVASLVVLLLVTYVPSLSLSLLGG